MSFCCYAGGYQVQVCRDFNEVIGNPIHHCCFVLISPWLKVLPSKLLQHWRDTAGLAVVTAAKPGGRPLYRLQFGNVGFCYRVLYCPSVLELWTNYGLVAFGLDILWAAWKISVSFHTATHHRPPTFLMTEILFEKNVKSQAIPLLRYLFLGIAIVYAHIFLCVGSLACD